MCGTQDTIKMHHADSGWEVETVVIVLVIGSGGRLYNMANVLNVQLSVCPYMFCPVTSASQSGDSRSFASA